MALQVNSTNDVTSSTSTNADLAQRFQLDLHLFQGRKSLRARSASSAPAQPEQPKSERDKLYDEAWAHFTKDNPGRKPYKDFEIYKPEIDNFAAAKGRAYAFTGPYKPNKKTVTECIDTGERTRPISRQRVEAEGQCSTMLSTYVGNVIENRNRIAVAEERDRYKVPSPSSKLGDPKYWRSSVGGKQ